MAQMQSASAQPTVKPPTFEPPMPHSIEESGLNLGFLSDLVLKVMYFEGYLSGSQIAERVRLPFNGLVDQVLEFLKREQLAEVKGQGGFGEQAYQYAITLKGRDKAREALDRSHYAGAAPVTLETYQRAMQRQSLKDFTVHQRTMRQGLAHLVLNERTFSQVGPAVNSSRSIFLYGPPGNGKTAIGESIGRMVLTENIYVPHAIEVDGQVIKVFDNVNHQRVGESTGQLRNRNVDPRWVHIRRPVIIVGGELTLETLDLVWDEVNKYYEAPFQMKANGGMFLIDDFGRQQVRPRDLLNRWILPLEKRVDYLTLHTGRKIEIPFDVLIVFSTNLAPKDLVDEAFLRRIRHKIEIGDPSFDDYREIFKRVCEAKKVPYDDRALAYLLQEWYIKPRRKMRAVHPRDLIDHLVDIARYLNTQPVLSKDLIDRACEAYFVEL
ncbi:MAG TPA: ATP-binding protein [Anaerolineae bacterium]|nr:ATP-binding protein [Anaerolineae bacterium]